MRELGGQVKEIYNGPKPKTKSKGQNLVVSSESYQLEEVPNTGDSKHKDAFQDISLQNSDQNRLSETQIEESSRLSQKVPLRNRVFKDFIQKNKYPVMCILIVGVIVLIGCLSYLKREAQPPALTDQTAITNPKPFEESKQKDAEKQAPKPIEQPRPTPSQQVKPKPLQKSDPIVQPLPRPVPQPGPIPLSSTTQVYDMVTLNTTSALCLDGSPYGYYISRSGDPQKMFIMIQGGGWCNEQSQEQTLQCYFRRHQMHYGSSKPHPPFLQKDEGILSNQSGNYFKDWKKIFMVYCDGSGYQGYRKQPIFISGAQIFLRGHNITVESFDDLEARFGLYTKVDQVVLAGQSAGGVAVYTWANYLKSKIKKGTLKAISDGSLFLDVQNRYTKTHYMKDGYANMMKYSNSQIDFPVQKCVQKFPKSQQNCFHVQNLIEFMEVPMFHTQSVYDVWYIREQLRVACADQGLKACPDDKQKIDIEQNRKAVLRLLSKISEKKGNGAWGTKCLLHPVILFNPYLNPRILAPLTTSDSMETDKNGINAAQAIKIWMENPEGNNYHVDLSQQKGPGFCY